MNTNTYLQILAKPELISQKNILELKAIIEKYPYFQSARALYLKALKNQESFKYNNELKITAAYTTDRTILFNFITSTSFNNKTEKIPQKEEKPVEIIPKEYSQEIIEVTQNLNIGTPISFTKNETHSFQEWLQLSSKQPIIRKKTTNSATLKQKKEHIINQFIANNPKISRINKGATQQAIVDKISQPTQLMTETLAKVYLEQKKYSSAIKAYQILSLKYPEKSGFFADQIKRIQILQNSK